MEHWIDAVSILPWWIALTLGIMSYGLLHVLAESPVMEFSQATMSNWVRLPNPLDESPASHAVNPSDISGPIIAMVVQKVAFIAQYLVPFIFGLGAVGSLLKARRNER
jgi:hypothetical protein